MRRVVVLVGGGDDHVVRLAGVEVVERPAELGHHAVAAGVVVEVVATVAVGVGADAQPQLRRHVRLDDQQRTEAPRVGDTGLDALVEARLPGRECWTVGAVGGRRRGNAGIAVRSRPSGTTPLVSTAPIGLSAGSSSGGTVGVTITGGGAAGSPITDGADVVVVLVVVVGLAITGGSVVVVVVEVVGVASCGVVVRDGATATAAAALWWWSSVRRATAQGAPPT